MHFSLAAVAVAVASLGPGQADPWAPGASIEPWPLIAALQSAPSLGSGDEAWQRAFTHGDPRVRAAAAWAAGRMRRPGVATALARATFESDSMVREAGLWGLLRLEDPAALPHLARVVATRRRFSTSGTALPGSLGEAPAGIAVLFAQRGLPVPDGAVAYRREWIRKIDLAGIERRHGERFTIESVRDFSWSVPRAEWDAGERVTLRAAVAMAGAHPFRKPEPLALDTYLVALDEWDSSPNARAERVRLPVRLRAIDHPDPGKLRLAPDANVELDLLLSLHEIPPGPYLLVGLETGHPVFLRVRRSPRREAAVQAAAAMARTPAAIEAVSRQRVASQAERWRGELGALLASRAELPMSHLRALARLGDSAAAGLLVDAALARPPLRVGNGQLDAEHEIVRAFGPAAVPHLERAALAWRATVDDPYASTLPATVLAALSLASRRIDDLRVEALRELAPLLQATSQNARTAQATKPFLDALVAVAARRPEEAGRVLATLADRPLELVRALDVLGSRWDASDFSQPGFDAVLQTAWSALPPAAAADSRSALVAEAEWLSISLPGSEPAWPSSREEALREIRRVRPGRSYPSAIPYDGLSKTLRRLMAAPLAATDGVVARHLADLALALTAYGDAAMLAERAVKLTPSFPARSDALLTRADVSAASGAATRERADLEEALPRLRGHPREAEVRSRLAALAARPGSLRVRTRESLIMAGTTALTAAGVLVSVRHLLVEKQDLLRGGHRAVGMVPWLVHGVAALGERDVVVLGADGTVGLLREGEAGFVWRAQVGPPGELGWVPGPPLAAEGDTVLVRNRESMVHAFDASTGRRRWSRRGHDAVPLAISSGAPVVLGAATTPANPDVVPDVVGVDPRSGRVLWSAGVNSAVRAWDVRDGRVAWVDGNGMLHVIDLRTGRPHCALPLPQSAGSWADLALVPGRGAVVVALADRLLMIDEGEIVWSTPPAPGGGSPSFPVDRVEVAGATIWRLVTAKRPVQVEAWSLTGVRLGGVELAREGIQASEVLLDDGTLAVLTLRFVALVDRVTP